MISIVIPAHTSSFQASKEGRLVSGPGAVDICPSLCDCCRPLVL